jgi:uncharacterized protein YjbI with pentapeptide repeats
MSKSAPGTSESTNYRLNVRGAFLRRTDLTGADLEQANLAHADFSNAVLRDANFKDAVLEGTVLKGADLTGARNLTLSQLAKAIIDENTRLPDQISRTDLKQMQTEPAT